MKILFVCHGNICRSPMAEFIFKQMLAERGLSDRFTVESAATSTEEIRNGVGNPIYPPARAELLKNGIPVREKRARQICREDLERFDLLVGMDHANLRNMWRILGANSKKKTCLLMDFTSRGGEVADPWYSDRFDITFRDIRDGCEGLLEAILTKKI